MNQVGIAADRVGRVDTEDRVVPDLATPVRPEAVGCTGIPLWGIVPLPRDRPWAAECGILHLRAAAAAAAVCSP